MSRRKISYVETNEDRIKEINRCRQVIELVAPSEGCLTYLDFKVLLENSVFMTAIYRLFDLEGSGTLTIKTWLNILNANLQE